MNHDEVFTVCEGQNAYTREGQTWSIAGDDINDTPGHDPILFEGSSGECPLCALLDRAEDLGAGLEKECADIRKERDELEEEVDELREQATK